MKARIKAFIPALLSLAGVVVAANTLHAQSNTPNSPLPSDPQHPQGTYDSEHPQKPVDPQHPEQNQPKEGTYNNTDRTKQPVQNPDQKYPKAHPDRSNTPANPRPRVPADDKTPKPGNTQHKNIQKPKSNQPVQPVPPGNK